jgi:hypothetical protein
MKVTEKQTNFSILTNPTKMRGVPRIQFITPKVIYLRPITKIIEHLIEKYLLENTSNPN